MLSPGQDAADQLLDVGIQQRLAATDAHDRGAAFIERVEAGDGAMAVHMRESMPDESHLAQLLFSQSFPLTHYEIERPTLETVFMKLTKGVVQ